MLRHLSAAQRCALVIADNQLAIGGAGWDEELLRIELATLHEQDHNLELVGFADVELARLLELQDTSAGLTDRTTYRTFRKNRWRDLAICSFLAAIGSSAAIARSLMLWRAY